MGMKMRSPVTTVHFGGNSGIRWSSRFRANSVIHLSSRFQDHSLLGGSVVLVDLKGVNGPKCVCKSRRVVLNVVDAAW